MTNRTNCAALVATFALTQTALAAPLTSLYAKSEITRSTGGTPGKTEISETWIKNGRLRMRFGKGVQIVSGKESLAFQIGDPEKRVMVMPSDSRLRNGSTASLIRTLFFPPPAWERKKMGTAKLLGYPTVIYDYPAPGANRGMRVWMATINGVGVPLRNELRSPEGTMVTKVVVLRVNPTLTDNLFRSPPNYRRIELPKAKPMKSATPGQKSKNGPVHRDGQ